MGRETWFIFTGLSNIDPNALQKRYYYRVAGELTTPCYPSDDKKAGAGPYRHALSNLDDNNLRDTKVVDILSSGVLTYTLIPSMIEQL